MAVQFFAYCVNYALGYCDTANIYSFLGTKSLCPTIPAISIEASYEPILRPDSLMEIDPGPVSKSLLPENEPPTYWLPSSPIQRASVPLGSLGVAQRRSAHARRWIAWTSTAHERQYCGLDRRLLADRAPID